MNGHIQTTNKSPPQNHKQANFTALTLPSYQYIHFKYFSPVSQSKKMSSVSVHATNTRDCQKVFLNAALVRHLGLSMHVAVIVHKVHFPVDE